MKTFYGIKFLEKNVLRVSFFIYIEMVLYHLPPFVLPSQCVSHTHQPRMLINKHNHKLNLKYKENWGL